MGLLYLNRDSTYNTRAELFSNNEQGLWLDPSDFSTMWQDAAGDTPVTAASEPVALILDKSRSGPSMGSNQVINGGFGADSDWTKGTGWTIGSGVATKTAGSASLLSQAQTMTVGRYYIVTYTITRTAGSITPQFAGGTTVSGTARSTSGTFTDIMTVVSGNNTLQLSADASFAGTVDNVSLKELSAGNHAYQTTSASRPTLARIPSSGRRNLLTRTEEFDNAAWTKLQCSISANNSTAPDGTSTADLIVEDSTTAGRYVQQAITTTVQFYTFSVYLKNPAVNGRRYALLYHNESVKGWAFDLQNGVVGAGGTTAVGAPAAYGIESVGNGWYRCYITITGTAASNQFRVYPVNNNGSGNASYTGDGVSGILVWGAQLETGSTVSNYQKVVATTDVTESGVGDLWHLVFDGSDDSLTTNSVDMTGTAQMTVIAGVRKLSDAAIGMVAELTASANANNGSFYLRAPGLNGDPAYWFASAGSTLVQFGSTTFAAPISNVVCGTADISSDTAAIRVNGASVATSANDQGSGNYSNAAIYIGRRGGSGLPFNGHIYQLIIRGKTTPTGKLLEAERFVARKTGVSF